MNDLEQAMMNEPNDSTSEDVPSHRWWAYARLTSGCDTSRARSCSCLRGNWTNASE